MTRLSVIIPGYNTPEKLWRRCLDSVRTACGTRDEIICVDDGSAERPVFLEEISHNDPRVKVVFLEKNAGQAYARNVALEFVRGEWVAFADSDDEVLPDIYERCFAADCTSTSDVVLFGVRVVWTAENLYKDDIPKKRGGQPLDIDTLLELRKSCLFEYPVNRLYRKSFLDVHDIRFDEGVCPGEDAIFNLKCVVSGAIFSTVAHIGYIYRHRFDSSLARYQKRFDESLCIKNELWKKAMAVCGGESEGAAVPWGLTGKDFALAHVRNEWRCDSPVPLRDRLRWLKANRGLLPHSPPIMMLLLLAAQIARRYFYFRPFRRMKIRRMYPAVKEFE